MIEPPSKIGARAELAVATALLAAGKHVYLPFFGADSRVDLVYEDEGGFHRVQCKSSRISRGAVTFATCSNTKNVRKDYRDDVDVFGVYSPELGKVFLVPVGDVPSRLGTLRLDAARNGQTRGVRSAKAYELQTPVPYDEPDGRGVRRAGGGEEVAGPLA